MNRLRAMLAPFNPNLGRKEWEGVLIAGLGVALWFFQRHAKWPRWSGGWMVRSLFVYVLIPFAIHAVLSLEGARRRYAGAVLAMLVAGALAARFALGRADPADWAIVAGGVALSVPLFFFCDPRELGVRVGEGRLWLPLVTAGYAITLIGIVAIAGTPSFLKSYPYVPFHPGHAATWVLREALELLDMFSWEFFFRGFLLFTLAPRIGPLAAILVQATLFACAHVNKPELEIYASIVGGMLLGQLCFRVRSMMPAFVAHQMVFLSAEIAGVWMKSGR
jgi:membrane protease YdiL (CAAX protease family)